MMRCHIVDYDLIKNDSVNMKKYFRLRLSDEVSEECRESGLRDLRPEANQRQS